MIIEFTGIPGSGKSTIIEKLKKHSFKQEIIFDIEKFVCLKSFRIGKGKLPYDLIVFSKIILLNKQDLKFLKLSIKHLKKCGHNWFTKINIFRNILKKLILHRFLLKFNKIFIVDEGLSHIPLSLFVDVSKDIDFQFLQKILKLLISKADILLIDASDDILLERITVRGFKGHRRIDFGNVKSIEIFMNQSRQVTEAIKLFFNPLIYMNDEYEIDIHKILTLIKL
jgi:GTPase SAR1 family protein